MAHRRMALNIFETFDVGLIVEELMAMHVSGAEVQRLTTCGVECFVEYFVSHRLSLDGFCSALATRAEQQNTRRRQANAAAESEARRVSASRKKQRCTKKSPLATKQVLLTPTSPSDTTTTTTRNSFDSS